MHVRCDIGATDGYLGCWASGGGLHTGDLCCHGGSLEGRGSGGGELVQP